MAPPRPTPPDFWCHILSDQSQGHSPGDAWADWLEREVGGFPIPAKLAGRRNLRGEVIPSGFLPVCVTKSQKDPAALIDEALAAKLGRSLNLVVLCSPWATRSPLVDQVVRTYKMSGRSNRCSPRSSPASRMRRGNGRTGMLPGGHALQRRRTRRTPIDARGADRRRFSHHRRRRGLARPAAYLDALHEGGMDEPTAERMARAYGERLRLMKLKIIAGVLGVSLGELTERDLAHQKQVAAQRKRQTLIRVSLFGLLSAVGLAAAGLAWKSSVDTAAAKEEELRNNRLASEASRAIEQAKKEAETLRPIRLNDEAIKLLVDNTPASLAQAKIKLLEAAELGSVPAQYNLARLLLDQKDLEGVRWLEMAAAGGNLEANNFLGICHLNRLWGRSGGIVEAGRCFQFAAEKGYPPAMINLGYVAERGTPATTGSAGRRDGMNAREKAVDGQGWFKLYQVQSVDRGDLPRDLASAHQHLRQAAELGHPAAQWTLGQLLLKGEGMPADGQAAVEWFHRLTLQKADRG
ncbi:uncharacterized protein NMB1327 [Verrucomicrobiota bacterium]|nr:uncharacterized protein NMB1327 [Verrucomicrobiota bacterium]